MNRQDAIAALREQADAVKALAATALYLFGFTARDESGPGGDIDLFIEYDRRSQFSLIELVGIKQLLERRLGVTVDLTTRDSLDPLLRDRIEAAAERVFLTERLVRRTLRAIIEAIEGVENATRGKTLDDCGADWLLAHRGLKPSRAAPWPLRPA
jgi:uncharacterized protein